MSIKIDREKAITVRSEPGSAQVPAEHYVLQPASARNM